MTPRVRFPQDPLRAYTADHLPGVHPWFRSLLLAGWPYIVLFAAVHLVLATTTYGTTPVQLLLVALVVAPQVVLARLRGADLAAAQAYTIAVLLLIAAAIGLAAMPPAALDDSYAAWFLGAITFDLLGLAVLGAPGVAWSTMAVMVALSTAWALLHDMPPGQGFGLVVRHVATLAIGTLIVVSLRRSRSSFRAFQTQRLLRTTEDESARARAAARRIAVEQVLDQAGPTLQAIADGRRFGPEDRRQLLALEGALRDQIRSPMLARGRLRESVASARRRGVNVLLMDEAEQTDPSAREAAAEWLADRLDQTTGGGFVGRLRDVDGAVRASAVNDDHGQTRAFPIAVTVP